MSDALVALRNACSPGIPATPEQYVDCTVVRGGNVFSTRVHNDLSGCPAHTNVENVSVKKGFRHYLFSGHIGSGKSSELLHLKECLEKIDPSEGRKRFFTVVLDASEYLDEYDVTVTDILLAIVSEVADSLRVRLDTELKDSYFTKRFQELKRFLLSDIEPESTELTLGAIKSRLKLLRTAPTARDNVRAALMPQTLSLLTEINTFFIEARLAVRKKGFHDFVLVIDNLEKIERFNENPQGEPSQRALFIEGAPQLTSLQAHVVYTVPLPLVRRIGPSLTALYGCIPFVLPMIKTEKRGTHASYPAGRAIFREILQKRTSEKLSTLFTEEALEFLITYCGGHVRQFMTATYEATLYATGSQVDKRAVQKAISQLVPLYTAMMGPEQWEKLARLERSSDQQWNETDPDTPRFFDQWHILEYVNGDDEEALFNDDVPWYAVHPVIRELKIFKDACQRLSTLSSAP